VNATVTPQVEEFVDALMADQYDAVRLSLRAAGARRTAWQARGAALTHLGGPAGPAGLRNASRLSRADGAPRSRRPFPRA